MSSSSRTLIAFVCGALLLVIGALLFVRSGSAGAPTRSGGPLTQTSKEDLSRALEPDTPRESVAASEAATAAPSPEVPVDLPPSRLTGLVLDAATNEPIDRFEVLHSTAGLGRAYVDTILGYESPVPATSDSFAGTQGRFEIEELDPRPQSLCAFAEGYERSDPVTVHRSAVAPEAGGPTSVGAAIEAFPRSGGGYRVSRRAPPPSRSHAETVVIRLRRASLVRGRVVDPATGVPVKDALVGWIDYSGRTRTGTLERFERTDTLGRFVLGSVPLSAKRILVGREDLGEALSERLELVPGETAEEVVIELRRSGG